MERALQEAKTKTGKPSSKKSSSLVDDALHSLECEGYNREDALTALQAANFVLDEAKSLLEATAKKNSGSPGVRDEAVTAEILAEAKKRKAHQITETDQGTSAGSTSPGAASPPSDLPVPDFVQSALAEVEAAPVISPAQLQFLAAHASPISIMYGFISHDDDDSIASLLYKALKNIPQHLWLDGKAFGVTHKDDSMKNEKLVWFLAFDKTQDHKYPCSVFAWTYASKRGEYKNMVVIDILWTHPDYRGKKYATKLIEQALPFMCNDTFLKSGWNDTGAACKLYKKLEMMEKDGVYSAAASELKSKIPEFIEGLEGNILDTKPQLKIDLREINLPEVHDLTDDASDDSLGEPPLPAGEPDTAPTMAADTNDNLSPNAAAAIHSLTVIVQATCTAGTASRCMPPAAPAAASTGTDSPSDGAVDEAPCLPAAELDTAPTLADTNGNSSSAATAAETLATMAPATEGTANSSSAATAADTGTEDASDGALGELPLLAKKPDAPSTMSDTVGNATAADSLNCLTQAAAGADGNGAATDSATATGHTLETTLNQTLVIAELDGQTSRIKRAMDSVAKVKAPDLFKCSNGKKSDPHGFSFDQYWYLCSCLEKAKMAAWAFPILFTDDNKHLYQCRTCNFFCHSYINYKWHTVRNCTRDFGRVADRKNDYKAWAWSIPDAYVDLLWRTAKEFLKLNIEPQDLIHPNRDPPCTTPSTYKKEFDFIQRKGEDQKEKKSEEEKKEKETEPEPESLEIKEINFDEMDFFKESDSEDEAKETEDGKKEEVDPTSTLFTLTEYICNNLGVEKIPFFAGLPFLKDLSQWPVELKKRIRIKKTKYLPPEIRDHVRRPKKTKRELKREADAENKAARQASFDKWAQGMQSKIDAANANAKKLAGNSGAT